MVEFQKRKRGEPESGFSRPAAKPEDLSFILKTRLEKERSSIVNLGNTSRRLFSSMEAQRLYLVRLSSFNSCLLVGCPDSPTLLGIPRSNECYDLDLCTDVHLTLMVPASVY